MHRCRWALLTALLAWPGGMPARAAEVRVVPASPRQGDVVMLLVRVDAADQKVEGTLGGRPLAFFGVGAADRAALAGIDLDTPAGSLQWEVRCGDGQGPTRRLAGMVQVVPRDFPVQYLTLPPRMVDLDAETERRALGEASRLRAVYDTVTPERFWTGPFGRPVAGDGPGNGFGARRVINNKPRAPHAGIDFAAAVGTPVLAANRGRVALVGEFFFPGRLVVLDHGLGLHTLYFHLDRIDVAEDALVERGDVIGTVGATGRATGPHLHFGAQVRQARIDPHALFTLPTLE
jgi:hypothetical protein